MSSGGRRHVATDQPYTWPPVAAFNAVGRVARALRRPLTAEAVRGAAVRRARASDFGSDEYEPGLHRFILALESEAALTAAGRWFARGQIVAALTNRLRIQRDLTAHPEIRRRPVGPAIVVLGLPRSGTTLLQHLLALDPANRSLRQWEAASPAPAPAPDAAEWDPRVRDAERAARLVDKIAPRARMLHPTGARLPTECVTLFANSFASLEFSTIYHVPAYTSWCLTTDMRPHYAYYATQLKILAWRDHRTRWSLKSPAHLFWMTELAEALPESRFVMLHRDPADVLGSFCSFVAVMQATNSARRDYSSIGRAWADFWSTGVARAAHSRRALDSDRIVDIRYTDLIADPVATVETIYGAHGLTFTPAFAAAIRRHIATHPQHGGGRHPYDSRVYGLDPDAERARFEELDGCRWR